MPKGKAIKRKPAKKTQVKRRVIKPKQKKRPDTLVNKALEVGESFIDDKTRKNIRSGVRIGEGLYSAARGFQDLRASGLFGGI